MAVLRYVKSTMASFALAIVVSGPVFAQPENPDITTQMVIQLQELLDEVRTLRGRVEELERELENMRQRQRDQYLDLDQRITGLRQSAAVDVPPAAPGETPGADPGLPRTADTAAPDSQPAPTEAAPAEDHPEVRAPLETPSETAGLGTPEVTSQPTPASPAAEKAAYEQAFQALKELRYADAAQEFQTFLDRYPNSEYAGNAQYWLGESYYVTRNYDIALSAFQRLLDRYPDSNKVPDGLLKIGYTHYELENWDQARAALTQVQAAYPDTTLARLAENRLRSMQMEGHY